MKKMTRFLNKTLAFAKAHKVLTLILVVIVFSVVYFNWPRGNDSQTTYTLGEVSRGTIVSSVSASGQVAVSDEIDIKPKASGDITWVNVKAGDSVYAGQAIAQIDSSDLKQSILDAEQSLTQAKLQFQKDEAQAPIDYEKTVEALKDAQTDLETTHSDSFNTLSDLYLAMPTVMTGLQNILYGNDLSKEKWNIDAFKNIFADPNLQDTVDVFIAKVGDDYDAARTAYDVNLLQYKELTRYSSGEELEAFLTKSTDMTTAIAQALQSILNLLDTITDLAAQNDQQVSSKVNTMRTNAQSYLSTMNSNLSALYAQQKSLDTAKKAIRDNERTLEIYKIGNPTGDNPISLQSSRYSLSDQERNLEELRNSLADYTVTAPFAGTIASLSVKRFDTVSSGTAVARLIANQKIAELSLNEIDAAKINVGDKATLTFDAIEGLTLTGEVVEIDAVGTVSQGVVSYAIKIAFDTQNEQIKPGMTVNASIITDAKQNTLIVPASAVHTQNNATYVLVFDPPLADTGNAQGVVSDTPPSQVNVTIGISDDINTEIVSGLSEGDQIIVRTSTGGGTTQTSTQAPSLFGGGGGRGGFGR